MTAVLVVGAGPVGLVMAAELARHGVPCRIIDALPQPSPYCRASGVTSRTLEVWEDMGIVRQMIDAGVWLRGRRVSIAGRPPQDFTDDLSDCPYATLGIPQPETERILTKHLQTFGITVERGSRLTALVQDNQGVSVQLQQAEGPTEEVRFRYVIGCDGAHSSVRQAVGIAFEGEMMPFEFMLGDVHIDWSLPRGYSYQSIFPAQDTAPEFFIAIPLPEPHRYRIATRVPDEYYGPYEGVDHGLQSERPTPGLALLQTKARQLVGEPVHLSDLRWSSFFRISMRLAESYRAGHVFLAGDAAHIHLPTGGQGMNTGIQDAYNLAWKLALVLRGISPESLLDSYTAERREEGQKVLERTMQAAMNTGPKGFKSGRLADTQLLVSYRTSPWVSPRQQGDALVESPQPGDRAPDCSGLRRQGVGYAFRLFDLLQGTDHVLLVDTCSNTSVVLDDLYQLLLQLGQEFGEQLSDWLRIVAISQETDSISPAPGITLVHDPESTFSQAYSSMNGASWLIRPDGYIGWCGRGYSSPGLNAYLRKVFSLTSINMGNDGMMQEMVGSKRG